ncbi:hypothetical protein WJX84_009901 [Apatococcus fuscideae]|uniref:Uncharacterized protein n=1 Tax=Apatococcus fuscideae TaxID=2026836 RepID=A0AAW1TB18_9CHLO
MAGSTGEADFPPIMDTGAATRVLDQFRPLDFTELFAAVPFRQDLHASLAGDLEAFRRLLAAVATLPDDEISDWLQALCAHWTLEQLKLTLRKLRANPWPCPYSDETCKALVRKKNGPALRQPIDCSFEKPPVDPLPFQWAQCFARTAVTLEDLEMLSRRARGDRLRCPMTPAAKARDKDLNKLPVVTLLGLVRWYQKWLAFHPMSSPRSVAQLACAAPQLRPAGSSLALQIENFQLAIESSRALRAHIAMVP